MTTPALHQVRIKSLSSPSAQNGNELPGGWQIRKLGDVCEKISLNGIKIKQKDYLTEGKFPVVDQGQELIGGYYNDEKLVVPDEPPYIIFGDHTKIKKFINFKFIAGADGVKVLKPNSNYDPRFFFYLIHTIKIPDKGYARHFQFLEKEDIPLPPLSEQQAIVAKIEELFSELDKGKEQLQTALQQLKVYRQSLLNSLINSETKMFIESVIETLDQGWSPKCLNESSTNNREWAVIKTTAVQSGCFLESENKRLPQNLIPRKQHELKKGDLLITRAGPRIRVGICCLVRKTRPNLLNCDKVYRMRINSKIALPEYIEVVLNSPRYVREIEKMKTGINDSGVNLTQKGFLKIEIPVPSLIEQEQIVSELESKLTVCDKIEESICQALQQAETLRQSILKKAFEGKLI